MDYKWKITLADDSVKQEGSDKFDLAWEEEGAVKKIEMVGEKTMSCNLETGEFDVDGKKKTISSGPKKLYFRKRNQVRTDGSHIIDSRVRFVFGFTADGVNHTASIRPKVGLMEEDITLPE